MGYLELTLIGVGLSMDAFAVSVCKGLSMRKVDKKVYVCAGSIFWRISGVDAGIWDGFLEVSSSLILQPLIIGSHLYCLY